MLYFLSYTSHVLFNYAPIFMDVFNTHQSTTYFVHPTFPKMMGIPLFIIEVCLSSFIGKDATKQKVLSSALPIAFCSFDNNNNNNNNSVQQTNTHTQKDDLLILGHQASICSIHSHCKLPFIWTFLALLNANLASH